MNLDKILNLALNKALIGKNRIKQVNSNEIADFVNKHLEAINYTHSCESDSEKLLFTQEEIVARINEQTVLDGESFRNYFDKK